ncbi:histone-lysine N-methyltransferase SETMAR [Trichonephila clavipes]|uniref:Histone-lysine N-methyltransferase SETMAR n=1 Tax=Trichonephila clavipes TaxID=2585209 RepID=A0A8X6STF7_TRICX|nr:histone-lysine N-methyltransferase SETMAR [Trichonephila clavipes]
MLMLPAFVIENVDKITEIIEVDRHVSSRSITQELKIDHKTVLSYLSKVGFKKKLNVWVPHQLTPKNMIDRISICEALAKRNEIDPFLKRMVIGDEKWSHIRQYGRKRSWSKRSEAAQTRTNIQKGTNTKLRYLLLTTGPRLKLVTDQKRLELANRRDVVFHQDNAIPHTSVVTHQKLWVLGWKVLMHPPYSTGLAPNDYHLFLALPNFQSDKRLGSREDCENHLLQFFANKGQDFFETANMKLPLKW